MSTLLTCRPQTGLYYIRDRKRKSWFDVLNGFLKHPSEKDYVFKYIFRNDYWIDYTESMVFVTLDAVVEQDENIIEVLNGILRDKQTSQIMDIAVHEWALKDMAIMARSEEAISWLDRKGYVPVYYSEGFLGNPQSMAVFDQ